MDQNSKKFKRANFFKIYLTNPSLRSALFSPIKNDDPFIGNLVETAIFAQWQHSFNAALFYARWKTGEIDIVYLDSKQKPRWCVEIKWSNRFVEKSFELKNLKYFSNNHNLKSVLVTTIDIEKEIQIDELTFEFIPASIYCYIVGKHIIEESGREF